MFVSRYAYSQRRRVRWREGCNSRRATILMEDVVASRKPSTAANPRKRKKARPSRFGRMEFYRALDCLPLRWRGYFVTLVATGLREAELCGLRPASLDHEERTIQVWDEKTSAARTIHVAEQFWPYVVASVPVPVTHWYLRDHWSAAMDRAGLKAVSVVELRRWRNRVLEEEKNRPVIRLLKDDARADARLLAQALPALALTDDEARRLLVREVVG